MREVREIEEPARVTTPQPGRGDQVRPRRVAAVAWWTVAGIGALLIAAGGWAWGLPWREEAVVVGQFWTPHFALVSVVLGCTTLTVCLGRLLATLHRWNESRPWAFEITALAMTALVASWLVIVAVIALGLIPADAQFTSTRTAGRVVVTRTTQTPDGIETTRGIRYELLVRWERSTFRRS